MLLALICYKLVNKLAGNRGLKTSNRLCLQILFRDAKLLNTIDSKILISLSFTCMKRENNNFLTSFLNFNLEAI